MNMMIEAPEAAKLKSMPDTGHLATIIDCINMIANNHERLLADGPSMLKPIVERASAAIKN